jgi:hypothetical protein
MAATNRETHIKVTVDAFDGRKSKVLRLVTGVQSVGELNTEKYIDALKCGDDCNGPKSQMCVRDDVNVNRMDAGLCRWLYM